MILLNYFLQVFDGFNSSAAQIGTYCGLIKQIPPKIRSSLNVLHVQFYTDSTVNAFGFVVNFSTTEGISLVKQYFLDLMKAVL